MNSEARIDKWLWAARIFKTRSIAADACKNGRVMVNGTNVKPSRPLKVGETVHVKKPPVTYSSRCSKLLSSVSVPSCYLKSMKTVLIPSNTKSWK